jgi:hypothetical protein
MGTRAGWLVPFQQTEDFWVGVPVLLPVNSDRGFIVSIFSIFKCARDCAT